MNRKISKDRVKSMYEIDKKKFGTFVAHLRREKGYTQKEMAEKLYISDKAVSKWETGASVPDTAMLIPLAELLGVTVTELLMGEHMSKAEAMDREQIENVVKKAIHFSEERTVRAYQVKSKWHFIYIGSLAIGLVLTWYNYFNQIPVITLPVSMILGAVFGAYFCFLVKMKLPRFYDENRFELYCDWGFRINVPGVAFNNSNWPYIVLVGRIWSCFIMILHPIVNLVMNYINKELWVKMELYVMLFFLLGGLFIPIYVVGKKYE